MDIYVVREVKNKGDLKKWIKFPYSHYRRSLQYIPQIIMDEMDFFNAKKNPGFKIAKVKKFLCLKNDEVVGRICGIIHLPEEKKLGYRRGRFGWPEFIDDEKVSDLLLRTVKEWLYAEDCIEMTGPHGFTDLDPEGMLIEGFSDIPTISGSYNYDYYPRHLEKFGFEKDADYVEYRVNFPYDDKFMHRMVESLNKDDTYNLLKLKKKKDLFSRVDELWELLEESFKDLYGITPLSIEQRKFYTKKYISFLDLNYVQLVENKNGKLVGFFLGMPNLSKSFKKAKGKLLPFGLFHILKEFKKPETVDFLLAGVHPDYSKKKIFLYLVAAMYDTCRKQGIKFLETNRELEENKTVNGMWSRFDSRLHRKTRIYKLPLSNN